MRKVFICSCSQGVMQAKLLKEIVSHIAGPNSVEIVDLLQGKANVNEFLIAKKLNITINQARNILYKLAEEGLVSFIRKKDKKNGGWYTYFWTLDAWKSLLVLKKNLLHEVEGLEKQLGSKQTKQFYYCPNCEVEMTEENALLCDFTCPECGGVFELKDNAEYIHQIKLRLVELNDQMNFVEGELALLQKKEDVSKHRKKKAEERKKKAERAERKKVRDKEKKKAEGGKEKKPLRKKPRKKVGKTRKKILKKKKGVRGKNVKGKKTSKENVKRGSVRKGSKVKKIKKAVKKIIKKGKKTSGKSRGK